MFAGLVVEVEGPLGLVSWAAMLGCPFVVVAAMACLGVTVLFLPAGRLGGSMTAEVFGICPDAQ